LFESDQEFVVCGPRIGPGPRRFRLPLEGNLDLTYRCNNACRHCWLWLSAEAPEGREELSFDEVQRITDQARAMGCRRWSISGGEPMLRSDFAEIFDYITRKSASYSLNTNGSLIIPAIAGLLTRKGSKLVALYGATAEVHDHITRNPGSFEATMRGFAYLKEAGAGFTVQLIPMRDNYHQWPEMLKLAQSLSAHYRVGAPWLYLSACGSSARNREIAQQRLDPQDVVALDPPDLSWEERVAANAANKKGENPFLAPHPSFLMNDDQEPRTKNEEPATTNHEPGTKNEEPRSETDDHLFAACIASRRDFHIDPYGQMTFCCFIKDPALRYDLRQGTFRVAWEEFIPSLADVVRGGREYRENCGSCESRADCRWCAVYGYLEHRRLSAKVDYLCQVARENRRFKEGWRREHRRYYQIAGITIQVDADLPITDQTFETRFERFRVAGPGEDTISLRHHFFLPELDGRDLGREAYRQPPWAIYRYVSSWIYLGISPNVEDPSVYQVAVFNQEHTRGRIYHDDFRREAFEKGGLHSLTLFPTDQILLARLLADRQGCYFHAAGMILDGQGLLFVGHSEAGKSTTVTLLQEHGEILCDDRMIVRRWPDGLRIHGTWSHGDVPTVSSSSAPLRALLFLEKAPDNLLLPIEDRKETVRRLLLHVVRPLVTADWWEKTMTLIERIAQEVPAYRMQFDKSGRIINELKRL